MRHSLRFLLLLGLAGCYHEHALVERGKLVGPCNTPACKTAGANTCTNFSNVDSTLATPMCLVSTRGSGCDAVDCHDDGQCSEDDSSPSVVYCRLATRHAGHPAERKSPVRSYCGRFDTSATPSSSS